MFQKIHIKQALMHKPPKSQQWVMQTCALSKLMFDLN